LKKQRDENEQLRAKKNQAEEFNYSNNNDMFQNLFAEKKHISYEKREITDKKIELIKDQIIGDQDRR
jgi:hypothetical protein